MIHEEWRDDFRQKAYVSEITYGELCEKPILYNPRLLHSSHLTSAWLTKTPSHQLPHLTHPLLISPVSA